MEGKNNVAELITAVHPRG